MKEFPLFSARSWYTDDSVMTVAVADALLTMIGEKDPEKIKAQLVRSMKEWGRRDPDAGYGGMFYHWLMTDDTEPYGSYGNGSAMRAAAAGWLYSSFEETWKTARLTAEVTHDHPEGIKGAECVAAVIWLARNGKSKEEIREVVTSAFGYDLSRTCDEIRTAFVGTPYDAMKPFSLIINEYGNLVGIHGTAPENLVLADYLNGHTLTCIAGSMAEAFYGVPEELKAECRKRVTPEMRDVLDRFDQFLEKRAE